MSDQAEEMRPWSTEQEEYLRGEMQEPSTSTRGSSSSTPSPDSPTEPISAQVRREVERLHRNFGHPAPESLAKMLYTAKADQDMVRYARLYQCPTCEARKRPGAVPKTTMPYRPTRFNHTVGIDLKFVHDAAQTQYVFLNVVDYATTFQLGILVSDKSARAVGEAFQAHWLRWAGAPENLVYDKGTEYQGVFRNFVEKYGLLRR